MPTRIRRPALDIVLAYRNNDVIDRFCDEWEVSRAEAKLVFSDLLRYLWLTTRADYLIAPVLIVDEMWHAFLMFTKPYLTWSQRTFGRVLHHVPTTETDKRAAARLGKAELAKNIERDVATVYTHLGEPTALRWYVLYSDRYTPTFFTNARRRPEVPRSWFPPSLVEHARKLNRGIHG